MDNPSGHTKKPLGLSDISLDGLSVQLNSLAALAGRLMQADFTALLCHRPNDSRLEPVAFHSRLKGTAVDPRPLEERWSRPDTPELAAARARGEELEIAAEKASPQDQFAAKHSFNFYAFFPLFGKDELECLIVGYWRELPDHDIASVQESLSLVLSTLGGLRKSAGQFETLDRFCKRMSELNDIFRLPASDIRADELATHLINRAHALVPKANICVIAQDRRSGRLQLKEHVGEEPPAELFIPALDNVGDKTVVVQPGRPTSDSVWEDLELAQGEGGVYACACRINDEPDARIYLVAWRPKQKRFAAQDRQLLGMFADGANLLLRNAALIANLKRANRVLKRSSQKLASNETLAALADMTSGLAHDFNNIIGAVIGRVQLMKLRTTDKNFLKDLDRIENLLLDGAQTVRRIQEFSTSARYKDLQKVDLVEIVSTYCDESDTRWQKLARQKNVTVSVTTLIDTAVIEGSPKDLGKVVEKLVENAVEHSYEKHRVEVMIADTGKNFSLSVSNRGPAISDDLKKKIFYPFFTTKPEPGAGLGLAMVQGVVARHNGKIKVESGDSMSTVFEVTFPKYDVNGEDSDITHRTKKMRELHVLVVDDDDQIREVLADMFVVNGHKVTACSDGFSALEAFKKSAFDLVITDLGMAGMSGLDLAGLVHEEKPQIPIAMITGWGSQLNHDEIALKGIRAVLAKPFHLKEITALVEQLVEP